MTYLFEELYASSVKKSSSCKAGSLIDRFMVVYVQSLDLQQEASVIVLCFTTNQLGNTYRPFI